MSHEKSSRASEVYKARYIDLFMRWIMLSVLSLLLPVPEGLYADTMEVSYPTDPFTIQSPKIR